MHCPVTTVTENGEFKFQVSWNRSLVLLSNQVHIKFHKIITKNHSATVYIVNNLERLLN